MTSYIVKRFGIEVDLSKDGHTGCPRCISQGRDRSKDNFKTYGLDEEGKHRGGFCFSCSLSIPSQVLMEENEEEEEIELVGSEFNEDIHEKLKKATSTDRKGYRCIRKDTTTFFGVRASFNQETGEVHRVYYPTTKGYELSGYKVRQHPKRFITPMGEVGKECELFGQFRFKTSNHTVIITGGEEDVLAAYQTLSDDIKRKGNRYSPPAVVSATVGESGAFRQCKEQYEYFNQFKKVIICLDEDEAGQEATEKLAEVLPRGKVFVMKMRYKDPNEYVTQGKEKEFIEDFWGAKPYVPQGVKSGAEGFDEIIEELSKPRITLPPYMAQMEGMMGGGIIQGRIVNIIAFTSVGKSAHVNRMVHHFIFNSPVKPTVVTLEATAAQYTLELLSVHLKDNILWNMGEQGVIDFLQTEKAQKAIKELSYDENGQPRFYLIDERDGTIEDVQAQIEMLWKKHGSKLFVIDVLSDLLRGSSAEKAEDHLAWQREMAKNGVTLLNVLHTRKPPNSEDGMKRVTEYDALGTGSFVQSAAINIVLNRDKLNEDHIVRNSTEVELSKSRGGVTGEAGKWYYDFPTATCYDLTEYLKDNPEARDMMF